MGKKETIPCPPHVIKPIFEQLKSKLYTISQLRKNYAVIPVIAVQLTGLAMIGYWTYHRLFVTTIDVQLGSQRWEMTSDSEFFDLRYPRSLKMFKRDKIEPAIGLDNRYRLMRGERMLDAKGNITNDYGDPPGVNSLEELAQQSQKKYALSK